jgi:hypothetical protein
MALGGWRLKAGGWMLDAGGGGGWRVEGEGSTWWMWDYLGSNGSLPSKLVPEGEIDPMMQKFRHVVIF